MRKTKDESGYVFDKLPKNVNKILRSDDIQKQVNQSRRKRWNKQGDAIKDDETVVILVNDDDIKEDQLQQRAVNRKKRKLSNATNPPPKRARTNTNNRRKSAPTSNKRNRTNLASSFSFNKTN
eukprot:14318_1